MFTLFLSTQDLWGFCWFNVVQILMCSLGCLKCSRCITLLLAVSGRALCLRPFTLCLAVQLVLDVPGCVRLFFYCCPNVSRLLLFFSLLLGVFGFSEFFWVFKNCFRFSLFVLGCFGLFKLSWSLRMFKLYSVVLQVVLNEP